MDYHFLFYKYISEKYLQFRKNKNILLRKTFDTPHTSNWSTCYGTAYLKDMYLILKGIEKIIFVMTLKILLICKYLNFTAVLSFSKVCIQFSE